MEKKEIVFGNPDGKKHSVRFFAEQDDPAIDSIYVRREHLGSPIPKKLKVTIEEG